MLQVHGELYAKVDPTNRKSAIKPSGIFGVLNTDQILWMVLHKTGIKVNSLPIYEGNVLTAATKMLDERGTATKFKYQGLLIHHGSSGVGNQVGCSIFYVVRPGNTAKIVGIGYHIGAQSYQLDWVDGMWTQVGRGVTLDDGATFQKKIAGQGDRGLRPTW